MNDTPARVPLQLGDGAAKGFLLDRDGPYDVVVGCHVEPDAPLLAAITIVPYGKPGIALKDGAALLGAGQRVNFYVSGLQRFSWLLSNVHHQAAPTRIWISLANRNGAVGAWPVYELTLPPDAGETRSFNIERT